MDKIRNFSNIPNFIYTKKIFLGKTTKVRSERYGKYFQFYT